jgi:hypothetical protein
MLTGLLGGFPKKKQASNPKTKPLLGFDFLLRREN